MIAITLFISTFLPFSSLYAQSPHESGYNHGCDDASISNPSQRYIEQPKKGFAYHTEEFIDGYNKGFASCSNSDNTNNQDLVTVAIISTITHAGTGFAKLCIFGSFGENCLQPSIDLSKYKSPFNPPQILQPFKIGELFSYCYGLEGKPRECIHDNKITEGEIAKTFNIKFPGGQVMDNSKEDMNRVDKLVDRVKIPFG